jgi:hypothetical protein
MPHQAEADDGGKKQEETIEQVSHERKIVTGIVRF